MNKITEKKYTYIYMYYLKVWWKNDDFKIENRIAKYSERHEEKPILNTVNI